MKIFCIGRNYVEHAKELNNPVPAEPVFFMKPETAILRGNKPFYYPDFSTDIQHEVELVLRISRVGRSIDPSFAHRYYDEIGLGVDFTARDLQQKCKEKGLPWEIAKAFDGSAPLGKFFPKSKFEDLSAIQFHLDLNGQIVQKGSSTDMLFPFDQLVAYLSRFFTFKIGDLIYTGTPAGVGPVKIGDHLKGFLEGELAFDFHVR